MLLQAGLLDLLAAGELLGYLLPILLGSTGHPRVSATGLSRSNIFTLADGVPEHNQTRMDRGLLPWWAHPTVSTSFLRPISGLLHVVDYTLFTPRWWLMHVAVILCCSLLHP